MALLNGRRSNRMMVAFIVLVAACGPVVDAEPVELVESASTLPGSDLPPDTTSTTGATTTTTLITTTTGVTVPIAVDGVVALLDAPPVATPAGDPEETAVVQRLVPGQALWRVGGRSTVVEHIVTDIERPLIDTNAAMGGRHVP